MPTLKFPKKLIDKTIADLQLALFEGDDNDFSTLRLVDAHNLLFMMQMAADRDPTAIEVYLQQNQTLMEYLPSEVHKYMNWWTEEMVKSVMQEQLNAQKLAANQAANSKSTEG